MIAGKLGGNNNPRDPETVINPKENERLYPSFNKSGNNSPPKARIVTPDPPVNAVKNPHRKTMITGVPPGIQPNNSRNTFTNRSEALLSASKYPARVNNGIVGNVGETTILYASAGMADMGVESAQKNRIAAPPRPTKMGAPCNRAIIIIKIPIGTTGNTSKIISGMALIENIRPIMIRVTLWMGFT